MITTREEYNDLVGRGYCPLLDGSKIEIHLRVEIQRELFGRGRSQKVNQKFYRWIWEHKPHICEETGKPLYQYSAVYISHILSRGAHAEMATDPRNINILCWEAHEKWENGKRSEMRIYERNQLTIEQLKKEYSQL